MDEPVICEEGVMAGLQDWARKLLEGRHYAILGTQDADGSLHLTPVWYVFRDEKLFVGAPSTTRKARNAVARPTASLVVDVRTPGSECWVSAAGPVTILHGDESRTMNAAIQERYLTPQAMSDSRVGPAFAAVDDVTLCLHPATWRSWTAADIDARFFGGILSADPQKWFRPVD
jgi:PPOX class probable F420-dependent enzyme